ncbi:MAG: phosphoribosyl-AMP cyclohydrolase [Myxococcota bacterium]
MESVHTAQQAWGQGIVDIGAALTNGGDYVERASDHIKALYAYGEQTVHFKPTKCEVRQFRPTFKGALSYFVGGNDAFPEDHGFAIAPWIDVKFINATIQAHGDLAIAMGNYYFTQADGGIVKVEYTFGYLIKAGMKIVLHHSSLPFSNG